MILDIVKYRTNLDVTHFLDLQTQNIVLIAVNLRNYRAELLCLGFSKEKGQPVSFKKYKKF